MKVAIMQPYFLPYLGYWQLSHAVDIFVIYDKVEYTKKGWINRNRIIINRSDSYITLPLRRASDSLLINQRELAAGFFDKDASALLRRVEASYQKRPFAPEAMEFLRDCLHYRNFNLFEFLMHSIRTVTELLQINTPIVISSELEFDENLRGQERVIAICEAVGANHYINPPGGVKLYEPLSFHQKNIDLSFLQPQINPYPQGEGPAFTEHLSILDVLMNVGSNGAIDKLGEFKLINSYAKSERS